MIPMERSPASIQAPGAVRALRRAHLIISISKNHRVVVVVVVVVVVHLIVKECVTHARGGRLIEIPRLSTKSEASKKSETRKTTKKAEKGGQGVTRPVCVYISSGCS